MKFLGNHLGSSPFLQNLQAWSFYKKGPHRKCFPADFATFFRAHELTSAQLICQVTAIIFSVYFNLKIMERKKEKKIGHAAWINLVTSFCNFLKIYEKVLDLCYISLKGYCGYCFKSYTRICVCSTLLNRHHYYITFLANIFRGYPFRTYAEISEKLILPTPITGGKNVTFSENLGNAILIL